MRGHGDFAPETFEIPDALGAIFKEEAPGFGAFGLRTLYRGLEGEPVVEGDDRFAQDVYRELGITPSQLKEWAPAYNRALARYSKIALQQPPEPIDTPVDFAKRAMKAGSLNRAIDRAVPNPFDRLPVRMIARQLRGKALPRGESADEFRRRLRMSKATFAHASSYYELAVQQHREGTSWRSYNNGFRRRRQQHRMSFVLPVALARRIPLIFNNQNHEPIDGDDIYGKIHCSVPLRSGAVGSLAYLLGIASHPDRFAGYNQIAEDGDILTSKTRLWQAVASVHPDGEPGGGGHRIVDEWVTQLAEMQLRATTIDKRGLAAAGKAPRLDIPKSPIENVRKLVDGEDGTEWTDWSDPRPPTRSAEYTLRFTIAPWCLTRIGTKGTPGDRIFFDGGVWRGLTPAARAMYLETQGRRAKSDDHARYKYVEWDAADPWARRFGLTHLRDDTREKIILSALNELYRSDERVQGYSEPWPVMNGKGKRYRVYLAGSSTPTPMVRERLRRADFLALLEASSNGAEWPGKLLRTRPSNAPPPDSS